MCLTVRVLLGCTTIRVTVYCARSQGAFAGWSATVELAKARQDQNEEYYGIEGVTIDQILSGEV